MGLRAERVGRVLITLLSNFTADTLAEAVSKATDEEVRMGCGYNTWVQDLINADFLNLSPQAVFLIIDGTQLLGDQRCLNWADAEETLVLSLDPIKAFAEQHKDTSIFVSSLDIPQKRILPFVSKRIEHRVESFWRSELEDAGIPVIELAEIARNMGREKFYSPRMWYLGSMPFSLSGERAIATEIARALNALRGRRKKCLVLDLDNTLWGGVIGEDGVGGIELSESKEGARFRDMQKRLKDLKDEGVMLAVVSKNNEEDALEGINKHPAMILRKDDFVAITANWDPKPNNIERLARDLNIGLDSFVFVDDNPVERQTVVLKLPDVAVPEFPKDTSMLEAFAVEIANKYFPILKLTSEDAAKTQQYQAEHKRTKLRESSSSLEDYLASLDMKKTFRIADKDDVARSAQLTQKTNQFNLTSRRYTEGDIVSMMRSEGHTIWIGELEDRFGSYGKIILAIVKREKEKAVIDTFLMSCRVMGRNVERDFLAHIEKALFEEGITEIEAEYIPTAKNSVVRNFWMEHGYRKLSEHDESHIRYVKKKG